MKKFIKIIGTLFVIGFIYLIPSACSKDSPNAIFNIGISHQNKPQFTNNASLVEHDSMVTYLSPFFDAIFDEYNEDTLAHYFTGGVVPADSTILINFLENNLDNYASFHVNVSLLTSYLIKIHPEGITSSLLNVYISEAFEVYSFDLELRENPCKKYNECIKIAQNKALVTFGIGATGGVIWAFTGNAPASLWSFVSGTANAINSYHGEQQLCCDSKAASNNCCI